MQIEQPNSLDQGIRIKNVLRGCGSKVSADTLSEVLDKVMGNKAPKGDAAVIEIPEGKGFASVGRSFPFLLKRSIHASTHSVVSRYVRYLCLRGEPSIGSR